MMPVASRDDALASTWYCAAATAAADGAANQTVIVYNPTDRPTTGSITAVPNKGEPKTVQQEVPPRGQVRVALTDLVSAPYASAVVEFRGGEVVVEHFLRGPNGVDVGPCATAASDQWYFAAGAGTLDASEVLVLFNPFPAAATVDVTFTLADGRRRVPRAVQGLQVPPRSVVAAPVTVGGGTEPQLSASVVARAGQVVAERILAFDGQGPEGPDAEISKGGFRPKGLAVTLGVPRPAATWVFPFGVKDDGLHERYVVYNPGEDEAQVQVAVSLADPARNGEVDPLTITINPGSWGLVDVDAEERIPNRVFHSVVVTSRNRVPVVAERILYSTPPLETSDVAISPGSPLVANRWIFAAGGNRPGQVSEWVAVANPGTTRVQVQLGVVIEGQVRALDKDSTFTIEPGGSRRTRMPASLVAPRLTLQVFADHPVVAERILIRPDGARTTTSLGIPSGDAEVRLAPLSAGG
jgi:hypothetical protein